MSCAGCSRGSRRVKTPARKRLPGDPAVHQMANTNEITSCQEKIDPRASLNNGIACAASNEYVPSATTDMPTRRSPETVRSVVSSISVGVSKSEWHHQP